VTRHKTGGALRSRPVDHTGDNAMTGPVKIMAVLTARKGRADEVQRLVEGMVEPSRAEPGNLRYDLWVDQADPARFVIDELYVDNAAIAAHRATPHFRDYLGRIEELAERAAYVLDSHRIG
jgi:quinol monooxygenase YgiN